MLSVATIWGTLIPLLAEYAPGFLVRVASSLAKSVISKRVDKLLKDRKQRNAYFSAIERTFAEFAREYPQLSASLFDKHFIQTVIAEELLTILTRHKVPDNTHIVEAYKKQFSSPPETNIEVAVQRFLTLLEEHLKDESSLQDLLTHRQTDEAVRILRNLDERSRTAVALLQADSLPAGDNDCLTKDFDLGDLKAIFLAASQDLLDWPQTLDGRAWLERPELSQITDRISTTEHSATLLIGLPGSGKSALLSRLATKCTSQGWSVLGIRADQLPEDLDSLDGLRAYGELPAPILECMDHLGISGKVVLLIDQLDALSELIDLKTNRLRVLLRLIRQATGLSNVHLVASCRPFERSYDKRLSSIDAEEIQLDLPPWEEIQNVLQRKGISSNDWPEAFREILRTPQCLKLFLLHFSVNSERHIFESYQAMLEHLWSDRLFSSPEVQQASFLVHEIATEMAEHETMFVPAAKYDGKRKELDYAVSTGLLQYDHTGRQISFTHQTLFDFSRARAFIANEQSLSRYVLERQTGLFVRPKLWSALHYLRSADFASYRREFETIWFHADLRPHLKMLLIDFVGQQDDLYDFEIRIMKSMFSDATYAPNAFAAIAGRKAWFDVVAPSILPKAMRASVESASSIMRVLEAAWPFAPDTVLDLLTTHWLPDVSYHQNAWYTLRALQNWNCNALKAACEIIERGDIANSVVQDLAMIISASAPDLAPELIGLHLQKQCTLAARNRVPKPSPSDEKTDKDQVSAIMDHNSRDPLRKIIDSHHDWYDVAAIAEAAPKAYLEYVWPHVRYACEMIAKEDYGHTALYQRDFLLATNFEVDEARQGSEYPLMDSFVYAVREYAKNDMSGFCQFVESNKISNSMTVHRLLALGLCELAPQNPIFVLNYLLEDPRRLSLENFHEDERETKILLRAVTPFLGSEDLNRVEETILHADPYKELSAEKDVKARQRLAKYARRFRLRLFLQIPKDRLTASTVELIDSELRIFDEFKDERRDVQVLGSRSAMSAQEMEHASNGTIEKFLVAFPDSTEWRDVFRRNGGSIQAAQAFAEFAKKDPPKAIAIIEKLDHHTQRPAAYAIRELAANGLDSQVLFNLVLGLNAKGFTSDEFRENVAFALRDHIRKPDGLPDALIDLLETWLSEIPADVSGHTENSDADVSEQAERAESVLWAHGAIRSLPHGQYPILSAFFFGLLLRDPIPSTRLLTRLRKQLDCLSDIKTWEAMAQNELHRLRFCDHNEAQRFLEDLFRAYPSLLDRAATVFLLAHSLHWATSSLTQAWMERARDGQFDRARQAYGELLILRTVLLQGDQWSDGEIERILTSDPSTEELSLCGLIYGAANLWKDSSDRLLLRRILCIGMDSTNQALARAAMDWFRVVDRISFDDDTRPILEAFAHGKALDAVKEKSYALDQIGDLVDDAPDLVYTICRRLINLYKQDVGNLATAVALEAETLLSIALTLQRQDEPHRSRGLELFESLLQYNAYKAQDVLMDIDRRPGVSIQINRLRRRRRKKPA